MTESGQPNAGDPTPPTPEGDRGEAVVRGSGNAAVDAAAERSAETARRNIPAFSELPVPEDTANLRFGPDLHPGLLALLPLVGVWEGEGEADTEDRGQHRFGQQVVVAHDGENYLSWTSRAWTFDSGGTVDDAAYREAGFWRISEDDQLEFLVAHASGVIEMYYGAPITQSAWEMATDVVLSSPTGPRRGGAKRIYGIVEDGDLGWVEERVHPEKGLVPHMSARLRRVAG
ncbi:FABP family protein [Dietzia sp. B32]|uniref:FABP family protein n=1 Tax=Dietzia sp. B32 TaxID=2915130 RepID=UPI0021AD950A|nr:FABP family protein [Dietzia sp. B32]UVE95297.1 FABP family protein [Dietzia sp. B32]